MIAAQVGMASVYHGVAVLLVIWAVAFGLLARNAPAPATAQRKGLGVMIEVLTREKLSWLLVRLFTSSRSAASSPSPSTFRPC